jgi:hypothetical protein
MGTFLRVHGNGGKEDDRVQICKAMPKEVRLPGPKSAGTCGWLVGAEHVGCDDPDSPFGSAAHEML